MRERTGLLVPIGFSFAALAVILAARSQLAAAIRQDLGEGLLNDCAQRGTWLLYSSWILAVGDTESLLRSKHLERSSSWAVVILLGIFLYLKFAA
jgi:hypothetical protein